VAGNAGRVVEDGSKAVGGGLGLLEGVASVVEALCLVGGETRDRATDVGRRRRDDRRLGA
jgi:hypothetical protein